MIALGGMPGGNDFPTDIKGFDFSEKSIRRAFVQKVYSILMVQLLVSVGFIALATYHAPTKNFIRASPGLMIVALIVMIVTILAISCCDDLRRRSPTNFIFLGIFTIAETFLLGVTASRYQAEEVMLAVGITAVVCFSLTLFAFQTKWDFTIMGGVLLVAVVILFLFGIIAMFVHTKTITLIYASLGALIFSFYLLYDTQMMMGGEHKYSISPEEYVFAALALYLDIINIFLYILQIIGATRD